MKLLTIIPILALLSLVGFHHPDHHQSQKVQLESFTDSIFKASLENNMIAGGAILVSHKGETLVDKSYGFASIELSAPMPENANFEIGSVTKQFTAAAILKLVEDQKLSLTDDFTDYLEFDTKGKQVTINNLLNHTSGIASYTEIPSFWELSIESHPRDSLVRMVEQEEFLFDPNKALIYNNSAYFFLGLIIEKVTGQSYEQYLEETFFEPLGMDHTYYCSNTEVIENKAYGYNFTPRGLRQKPYLNHLWPYAAGSLCSTTEDLYTWTKALHTGKVFSKPSYNSMITPDRLGDGSPIHYAKGLVNYSNNGHQEISHGGGIHGFLSEARYYPQEDLYIICLINTTGPHGASFFAEAVTWELLEKKEPQTVDIDLDLKTLEGKYSGAVRGTSLTVEIKAIEDGIAVHYLNRPQVDTIHTYIGNHTWMDGNDIVVTQNGQIRVDEAYGYFILEKED